MDRSCLFPFGAHGPIAMSNPRWPLKPSFEALTKELERTSHSHPSNHLVLLPPPESAAQISPSDYN